MTIPCSPQAVAVAKADDGWRLRTLTACALVAGGVTVAGAASVDWSEGLAMALGQMAGVLSPLAVIGVTVWAGVAFAGRGR